MKLLTRKAAFIFRYFMNRTFGHDIHKNYHAWSCELTSTFDDGMDFAVAFRKEFPGYKNDPNHKLASIQLTNIMKRLVEDGWFERWRLGNECDLPGTPKWQYVYKPKQWLINELKNKEKTPEEEAIIWNGE